MAEKELKLLYLLKWGNFLLWNPLYGTFCEIHCGSFYFKGIPFCGQRISKTPQPPLCRLPWEKILILEWVSSFNFVNLLIIFWSNVTIENLEFLCYKTLKLMRMLLVRVVKRVDSFDSYLAAQALGMLPLPTRLYGLLFHLWGPRFHLSALPSRVYMGSLLGLSTP